MGIIEFQNTDRIDVIRIRDATFGPMNLRRFIWQPCQQVESLQEDCAKYVWSDGVIRGYGAAYSLDQTHFRLNLIVDPDRTHQGIGSLLLSRIEIAAGRLGAKYLQARLLEKMQWSFNFALRKGFTQIHTMKGMSLSKSDFSYERWKELGQRLAAQGFIATTLKEELETDNQPTQKLGKLHRSAQQGWPSPDPTWVQESPIESLEERFENISSPDCFTIMKFGEEYVGYTSALNKVQPTAVHPNYRSLGIATYMKALDLKRGFAAGKEYFESATANPAMQRVNEKLGYRFNGLCEARFLKYL